MRFKIGDRVSFISEVGSGVVLEVKSSTIILEDENGFEMEYPMSLLVPSMNVSEEELLGKMEHQSKVNLTVKKTIFTPKRNSEAEWKIDLHMENLVDSHRNMTNHEIITVQLNHFKRFITSAEKAKIGRLVIVHGVGTGKLKSEISAIVKGINGAEIFDGDYSEYGRGASVIERRYNIR